MRNVKCRSTMIAYLLLLFVLLPIGLAISDSNSSNDNLTVYINITQTNAYPKLFINYGYEEDDILSSADFNSHVIEQNKYVDLFFPIKEENTLLTIPDPIRESEHSTIADYPGNPPCGNYNHHFCR